MSIAAERAVQQLQLHRAQPNESRKTRDWIAAHHYSKSAPPGYRFAIEFTLGRTLVGAMLLGRPNSRELDEVEWLELTRMHFVDLTPQFLESHALSMMRRYVRTWVPQVRALLAYSDPERGHEGTVYRADGWACFGRTRNSKRGWRSRPGRTAPTEADPEKTSRKLRWVRTP